MTDRPLRGKVIGSSVIASVAARAARETPDILRLGPSGRAAIDVEIATDARFNALEVAADLQERVRRALRSTGVDAGPINVTILAIEEPPSVPPNPGR